MERQKSMADVILQDLKEKIVTCTYTAGTLITEAEISQEYGSSKTPAREALGHLCIEGHLEKIPRKGYIVKSISMSDVQNLFQYRYILESATAELAAQYATSADIRSLEESCPDLDVMSLEELERRYYELNWSFHLGLARLSGNPYLAAASQSTIDQLRQALTMDLHNNPREALHGHQDILEAIRNRDPELARERMQIHLQEAKSRIYDQKSRHPVGSRGV